MIRKNERRKGWKPGHRREGSETPDSHPPSSVPSGLPGYRVLIIYTEPEFQMRNPDCTREFSFRRDYPEARSPQEALKQAVEFFDFCAENSNVGWRRVIQSVTVESC